MKKLIAIPYPAPSIPAAFRLYHGGWAKSGQLQTPESESAGFIGPYVYFSPRKAYAASYASNRSDLPARGTRGKKLFVVDSRALPAGCLVLMGVDRLTDIDGLFWDLFLFRNKVDWWESELSKQGVRTWMLNDGRPSGANCTDGDGSRLLGGWLSEIDAVLLSEDRNPGDRRGLQPQTVDRLQRLNAELGLRKDVELLSPVEALARQRFVAHQLNHPLLFALSTHGTANLDAGTVRRLLEAHTQAWLATHAQPLRLQTLPSFRNVAAVEQARSIHATGGQINGHMTRNHGAMPGDIVLVPGPIDVLRRGISTIQSGRRSASMRDGN